MNCPNFKTSLLKFSYYLEAVKMNTPFIYPEKIIPDKNKKGGTIVLSNDINMLLNISDFLNETGSENKCSIGKFFRGTYSDRKNSLSYSEKSLCIRIHDMPSSYIAELAKKLILKFNLKKVLLKDDRNTNFFTLEKTDSVC